MAAWETRMVSMTKKAARGQPFFVPLHEKYAVLSSRDLTIGAGMVCLTWHNHFISQEKSSCGSLLCWAGDSDTAKTPISDPFWCDASNACLQIATALQCKGRNKSLHILGFISFSPGKRYVIAIVWCAQANGFDFNVWVQNNGRKYFSARKTIAKKGV